MSTRLDLALSKYPEHVDGIRLLAERDPSGNLKYLDWAARILASGQALAPEVADILDLFHRFAGQWAYRGHQRVARVHPDVNTYRPEDLASLRTLLLKLKRARDKKRRERERLYKIEGSVEADVVYDSIDLVVRHVKNKQAGAHYGLGTKWCIAMLREGYFDDYEANNATFFYFERKVKLGDEFDKVALMVVRDGGELEVGTLAFTSLDRRVDMLVMAKAFGLHVFDIFRRVYEVSEAYPGSTLFRVYSGKATEEELRSVLALVTESKDMNPHETDNILESICCNDAAPWGMLEDLLRRAPNIASAARKRGKHRYRYSRGRVASLTLAISAALAIHPNTPAEARAKLVRSLRRRRIKVNEICRTEGMGRVGVLCHLPRRKHRVRRRERFRTVRQVREHVAVLERRAARFRKKAKVLEKKQMAATKKRAKAAKKR